MKQLKPKINLRPKKSWFAKQRDRYRIVKEMIGRTDTDMWTKVTAIWNVYKKPTMDTSKVNYPLAKSFYYASEVTDRKTGKKWGIKFVLGAVFAKPIVNSITNFVLSSPVQIDIKDKHTKDIVNKWLKDNHGLNLQAVRNSFREGDSYVKINSTAEGHLVAPECVDKIVNPKNIDNILGYDVTYIYQENNTTRTFLIEYRKDAKTTYELTSGKKVKKATETYKNGKLLEIVQISNEPEPNALYGNTEYQSCVTLMANYHAVLESAIQNHIYNSTPVPVIEGIENMQEFLEKNGEKDEDGNYQVKWDGKKMFILGKGATAKMMQISDTSKGTETLLNILFWCICQSSETPEFVFGTAVQSSKASVSEQMPIMIAKAKRKQAIVKTYFKKIIELLISQLYVLDKKIKMDLEFDVIMPSIIDEDKKLNLEIIKVLLEQKIITKETAATIAGVGEWVDNIGEEVEKAKKENKDIIESEMSLLPPATSNRATKEGKQE